MSEYTFYDLKDRVIPADDLKHYLCDEFESGLFDSSEYKIVAPGCEAKVLSFGIINDDEVVGRWGYELLNNVFTELSFIWRDNGFGSFLYDEYGVNTIKLTDEEIDAAYLNWIDNDVIEYLMEILYRED